MAPRHPFFIKGYQSSKFLVSFTYYNIFNSQQVLSCYILRAFLCLFVKTLTLNYVRSVLYLRSKDNLNCYFESLFIPRWRFNYLAKHKEAINIEINIKVFWVNFCMIIVLSNLSTCREVL